MPFFSLIMLKVTSHNSQEKQKVFCIQEPDRGICHPPDAKAENPKCFIETISGSRSGTASLLLNLFLVRTLSVLTLVYLQ